MFTNALNKRIFCLSVNTIKRYASTQPHVKPSQQPILEHRLHGAGLAILASELRRKGFMKWIPAISRSRSPLVDGNSLNSLSRKDMQVTAKNMYIHMDKLNDQVLEYFYGSDKCNMPFTFQSWFSITQLHLWMCQSRLRPLNEPGKQLSQFMLDHLTSDIELKMWSLGANNPVATDKQLMQLLGSHYGCSLAYDEGFEHSDAYLASALWRNMYFMDDAVSGQQLYSMTYYVRYQMQRLFEMSDDEFVQAKFDWSWW